MNETIEGLTILSKYFVKPDGYHLGADHGELRVYQTDFIVSIDDINTLVSLGWVQQTTSSDDFSSALYSINETWILYL